MRPHAPSSVSRRWVDLAGFIATPGFFGFFGHVGFFGFFSWFFGHVGIFPVFWSRRVFGFFLVFWSRRFFCVFLAFWPRRVFWVFWSRRFFFFVFLGVTPRWQKCSNGSLRSQKNTRNTCNSLWGWLCGLRTCRKRTQRGVYTKILFSIL